MRKTVVLIHPTILPEGVEFLKDKYNIELIYEGDEVTLINTINKSNAEAVVTRAEKITSYIIKKCPSLQVIGYPGVGVDHIDIEACTAHGVAVVHAPDENFISVAEHAMLFILALSRQLVERDYSVRHDKWNYRDEKLPMEIHSKTLFIIGLGKSGREVAGMAKAFRMRLIGYSRSVSDEEMKTLGIQKVDHIAKGLVQADFVSLHVPLTDNTYHLISEKHFAFMKNTSYLINLSRGPVVDQEALVEALKNNQIAGAALDVLDAEPPSVMDPLLSLKNVILTPHIGGDTKEAKERCVMTMVKEMDKVLTGHEPEYIVNPEVIRSK